MEVDWHFCCFLSTEKRGKQDYSLILKECWSILLTISMKNDNEKCGLLSHAVAFSSTATHHRFMDDDAMSAAERRKSYQKNMKAGKGHSLDDSSMASHSTGGMKAAASESQLNESNDSFLSPPKDKRSSSKLSLLADKVLEFLVQCPEKVMCPFCMVLGQNIYCFELVILYCFGFVSFRPSVSLHCCVLQSLYMLSLIHI